MNSSGHLKKLLSPADCLIIIPPFSLINYPSLGVHTLQALGKEEDFSVQVYYGNIDFSNRAGPLYDTVCHINAACVGEGIFARAAHSLSTGVGKDMYRDLELYKNTGETYSQEKKDSLKNNDSCQFSYFHTPPESLTPKELKTLSDSAEEWAEITSDLLLELNYPVIGCSMSYEQTNAAFALLKRIKKKNPHIITFTGGFSCEGECAEGVASLDPKREAVDFIFSGESEKSFKEFIRNIQKGSLPERRIIHGELTEDLDTLPLPDYENYFSQLYSLKPEFFFNRGNLNLQAESSRGCWRGVDSPCLFCGCNGERMAFRKKSPQRVLSELRELKKYGIKNLLMTDLAMPREYYQTLLPKLAEDDTPYRIYYEQVADLNYRKMKKLSEAGILDIQPGLESLNDSLLKRVNKKTSLSQNIEILRYASVFNLNILWNMLWGIPGERISEYEEILSLIPYITHLQPPFGIMHLVIARFSPFFKNPEKFGISNIRPLSRSYDVWPHYGDVSQLCLSFTGDYTSETRKNPGIIMELMDAVEEWNLSWKNKRNSLTVSREKNSLWRICDTRSLWSQKREYCITKPHLLELLTGNFLSEKRRDNAVTGGLILQRGNQCIPLLTGEKELFEEVSHSIDL